MKETLHENGIEFFSFWEARGAGMARESRVYLQIVVRDVNLDKTIEAIFKSAVTGEVGDGKIFVSTVDESIRIRTGEKGDESLYIKD